MNRVPLEALFSMIESPTMLSLVSVANGLESFVLALDQQAAVAELSLHYKDSASIRKIAGRLFRLVADADGRSRSRNDVAALVYTRHLIENGLDVRSVLAARQDFPWSRRFLRALAPKPLQTDHRRPTKGDNDPTRAATRNWTSAVAVNQGRPNASPDSLSIDLEAITNTAWRAIRNEEPSAPNGRTNNITRVEVPT